MDVTVNNEIKLLKELKENRGKSDIKLIDEFYDFLTSKKTENQKGLGLSFKKAFEIIYYLQEYLPVFPDSIEQCWACKRLFDRQSEGLYWESKGRHYCGICEVLVPENYDIGSS